jgi:acetylornithine deacetylase
MPIPRGDAVALTRELVRVDSRNPSLVPGAPGETAVASVLAGILESWGFTVRVQEAAPGRPNVVAWIPDPGATSGAYVLPPEMPALLFNGHIDVVGTEGMVHAPFDATTCDGRMYGRGATDMKGGVAAMCAAAVRAFDAGVRDGVLITAVADEEFASIGTAALVKEGLRARGAIVTEPTRLAIAPAHKGFAWIDVEVRGRAAHGSRPDIGVDAIRHAALILAELDRHERETLVRRSHLLLGHASLHASLIDGGSGMSTYPDRCLVRLERRTIPGETAADAEREVVEACARVRRTTPALDATVTLDFSQEPSDVAVDAPIVQALGSALTSVGEEVRVEGLSAWTDAALLNAAGIPAICFGPGDIAMAHSAEEWVDMEEIERSTIALTHLVATWCGNATAGGAGGASGARRDAWRS